MLSSQEDGSIMILLLQLRKLRHREGLRVSKVVLLGKWWQKQISKLSESDSTALLSGLEIACLESFWIWCSANDNVLFGVILCRGQGKSPAILFCT